MTAPLPATRGLYPPTPLTPSPASNTDSFPPRPHGQEAALPPEGPRVDSKPLRELEDILDSFAINALHRQTLPPIPDDESLRDSITSSAAPSVAPLALNRSPRSPVPQIPSSPSIDTLSPDVTESFLAYRQASPYEMSHSVSVYSHAGDIGELPADSPPVPTPPLPVGGLAAILQAPAPAIFRSDSTGRTPLGGGVRKAGYRSGDSDSTTLSELADFPSPTATATHFVRKVSIKQENPVRLTREESLRLREAAQARRMTAAERDIVSQMGLDSLGLESPKSSRSPSPSALSISPPETPRDFNFGPLGGGPDQRKDAFQDPLQGTGFVPLSAMTLDPGAGNYRSATESICEFRCFPSGLEPRADAPHASRRHVRRPPRRAQGPPSGRSPGLPPHLHVRTHSPIGQPPDIRPALPLSSLAHLPTAHRRTHSRFLARPSFIPQYLGSTWVLGCAVLTLPRCHNTCSRRTPLATSQQSPLAHAPAILFLSETLMAAFPANALYQLLGVPAMTASALVARRAASTESRVGQVIR